MVSRLQRAAVRDRLGSVRRGHSWLEPLVWPLGARHLGAPGGARPPAESLWLFDLLRGVTEASQVGSDAVRAQPCRRLRASVDVARVANAVPGETPLPPGTSYERLRALPLDVGLDDDGYVRRIRFRSHLGAASQTYELELFDLGTDDAIDFSRLPLLKDHAPARCPSMRARRRG